MPGRLVKYCGDCRRGLGVEARANAISRDAMLFVDAELGGGRCCGGDGATTGAGQSVQGRVKGRRRGNVCGPHEVNLVTTARG